MSAPMGYGYGNPGITYPKDFSTVWKMIKFQGCLLSSRLSGRGQAVFSPVRILQLGGGHFRQPVPALRNFENQTVTVTHGTR